MALARAAYDYVSDYQIAMAHEPSSGETRQTLGGNPAGKSVRGSKGLKLLPNIQAANVVYIKKGCLMTGRPSLSTSAPRATRLTSPTN